MFDEEREVIGLRAITVEPSLVRVGLHNVRMLEPAARIVAVSPAERKPEIPLFQQAQHDTFPLVRRQCLFGVCRHAQ